LANELRRRRPRPGDKWRLDEVFLKINGQTYYLWRAVAGENSLISISLLINNLASRVNVTTPRGGHPYCQEPGAAMDQ